MRGKFVYKVFLIGTKWKDLFLNINLVGEEDGLEPILMSKLSVINCKKTNFSDYITEGQGESLFGVPNRRR